MIGEEMRGKVTMWISGEGKFGLSYETKQIEPYVSVGPKTLAHASKQ
jgi:hypothetical protein